MKMFLLPRLRDILFIAIFLGALLLGPRMLSLDSDLGRHLTLGGYILETRHIPTRDLFSHTRAGDPRPPYEWLTQALFAGANRLAGLDGVLFATALIVAAAFAFVYTDAARRRRRPLAALFISILAAAASSLHWLPRPHVVTFLFLAIWLERLERVRSGERVGLWQFPALMLIWVNAHGGFIFGILAWLAYFTGWVWETISARLAKTPKNRRLSREARPRNDGSSVENQGKKLALIGLFSFPASILTPSLWGNWQAVSSNNSRYILSRTVETMPPDFTRTETWPFVALLILVFLAMLYKKTTRKPFPSAHVFLLAGFAALGLWMARNIPLFAIIAAPILAESLPNALEKVKRWNKVEANIAALENPLRGALWPILLGLGIAFALGNRYQVQKEALTDFDARVFPVTAADWLVEHPQSGNMFNDFNWGGYLLYRLWPEQKVFLDSQTDFYGEALVREYETAWTAADGWENALNAYAVDWAILPVAAPLSGTLQAAGWQLIYQDETTVIFVRR